MRIKMTAGWLLLLTLVAPPARSLAAPNMPEFMYNKLTRNFDKTQGTGEQFCWGGAFSLSDFLGQYEATGDAAWLDWGAKYYDALIGKMAAGPDGYKGWIGPYIYDGHYWCDVHVGDAVLFSGMLDFSYAVSRDPKLKEKYRAKAMQYVERAKRDLFEKWDSRGTWKDMGAFGVYVSWDKYGLPGQYKDWQSRTPTPAGTGETLPFNKQEDLGECAIRIWQITGDAKYKHRAEQIFGFAKSRIQNFNGCYHWNYWEPGGQWDMTGPPEDPFCLWINTHGERPYQAGEVAKILKAYNAGIVFTKADMQAIINTNLKVMWNGDLQHPSWANSNADIFHKMGQPVPAGCVWSSLAQLDATEHKLTADWVAGLRPNRGRNDLIRSYFNQVTAKTTPRFQRLDVSGEVEIPAVYAQFPLGNVRIVTFAAVLPPAFSVGEKAVIACKLSEPGDLDVALYSADGKTRLATLLHRHDKGGATGHEGVVAVPFPDAGSSDATKLAPGAYRVRWTVAGDGYREFPFTLRPAKP